MVPESCRRTPKAMPPTIVHVAMKTGSVWVPAGGRAKRAVL